MKYTCQARILTTTRRKQGSGVHNEHKEPIVYPNLSGVHTFVRNKIEYDVRDLPICGGLLDANIRAEDEPSWGDHYAVVTVEFECQSCKNTIHLDLPRDVISLNEWITRELLR